ncbi:MAG: peroxidase-related enzyme [Candidatus Latescibacterota bacterium]|nr:MAG: peroxidase-related enzyme [Candidatus Latescibacterota bacterium]
MTWIRTIPEDKATDYLKTYYKKYGDPFEGVPNILKALSLKPDSLRHHYDLFKHLTTGKSGLSRMQREMIGVVVAKVNNCEYCLKHHKKSLYQLTKNPFLIGAIENDFHEADVPEKDIAMLEYAKKLAADSSSTEKKDVDALREAGFKDIDILDIAQVAAFFSYADRLANGLGVELEPHMDDD